MHLFLSGRSRTHPRTDREREPPKTTLLSLLPPQDGLRTARRGKNHSSGDIWFINYLLEQPFVMLGEGKKRKCGLGLLIILHAVYLLVQFVADPPSAASFNWSENCCETLPLWPGRKLQGMGRSLQQYLWWRKDGDSWGRNLEGSSAGLSLNWTEPVRLG